MNCTIHICKGIERELKNVIKQNTETAIFYGTLTIKDFVDKINHTNTDYKSKIIFSLSQVYSEIIAHHFKRFTTS